MTVESTPVHVILVHGTRLLPSRLWGWISQRLGTRSNRAWTTQGMWVDGIASNGWTHSSFEWSGANSHRARVGAAQRLREVLLLIGDKRVTVVAHSHGGNVALLAIHGIPALDEPPQLVTLGTPFISHTTANRKGGFGVVVSALLLLALAPFFGGDTLTSRWWTEPEVLLLASFAFGWTLSLGSPAMAEIDYETLSEPNSIKVILAPADEAGLGLGFAQFAASLGNVVPTWVDGSLIILFALGAYILPISFDFQGVTIYSLWLLWVVIVVAGVSAALRYLAPLAIGVDGFKLALGGILSCDAAPRGTVSTSLLEANAETISESPGHILRWKRHSSFHSNAGVIEAAFDWVGD